MSLLEREVGHVEGASFFNRVRSVAGAVVDVAFHQMSDDVPAYDPDHWRGQALSEAAKINPVKVMEGSHPGWVGFDAKGEPK